MKRIVAATLVAILAIVAADTATAKADPRPFQSEVVTAKVQLVSERDFNFPCLSMDRANHVQSERVDVTFKAKLGTKWVDIWQAEDGLQFYMVVIPQNQPWGCIPAKYRVAIPASWTQD